MSKLRPDNYDARPRTVVFVESSAAMGGVQFSTLYLAQRLSRTHWHPLVVCPEEGDLTRACREAGIETRVLGQSKLWSTSVRVGSRLRIPNLFAWARNGWAIVAAARKLKRLLIESRPDLVVTKGLPAHFFGGLAARQLRIPCVWHVQDFISERNFGIYRRLFAQAARWLPKQIIADGHTIRQQLPKSLLPRVTVIHNGIDPDIFRPGVDGAAVRQEFGIPANHLVIGHAGRVTPWKGQHFLIEAFAGLARENPNATLLIVGAPVFDNDLYLRRLHNTVVRLGLDKRVVFAGYRHDLPNVLAAMDVFAFTSLEKDTSPLTLLSAMSCGLPIIAFDIAGVRELIDGDDQIRLVPLADVSELRHALAELASDTKLRQQLGASVRNLVTARFNLGDCTAQIATVLTDALRMSQDAKQSVTTPSAVTSKLGDCA